MSVSSASTARNSIHAADFYPTFTFSTNTTTNANPGAGFFRFNNATVGSISEFSISNTGHFEGGDQDTGYWQNGWAGLLFLKNVANDDIIVAALGTQLNTNPYLRMSCSLVSTVIGGVPNATPTNNSVWRFISVGDYIISANVDVQLQLKQNRLRAIGTLNDTDSISLDTTTDTYYQSAGSGLVTESVVASAGRTVVLKCDVSATKISFVPVVGVDGLTQLDVIAGAYATIQSLGSGSWIIVG